MLLDRLDGPLVRKLEIDQKVVVGIVAHFEVACREIVGEESAAKIVARTIELLDAGTDPAGSTSESVASSESAQPQPDQAVRDVPQ